MAVVLPIGDAPADGWPVVIQLNGTGGSFTLTHGFGGLLAEEGLATVGIDLPLHGARGNGSPIESVVDLTNALSSVNGLVQGAADQVWLVELLSREGITVQTPAGPVALNPDRIGYLGHSQGGIHGALAAAHFDGRVKAAMLSGTGGGVFWGSLLNEKVVDVVGLVKSLFGFVEGEVFDDFHPVGAALQHAADPGDPLHTAPFWFAKPGLQSQPLPAVYVTMGREDRATAPFTTQAMVHAAQIPIIRGQFRIPADEVAPPQEDSFPASANTVGFDGEPVTAGLVQYRDGGHGAGLDDWDRVAEFLRSALVDGQAVIE